MKATSRIGLAALALASLVAIAAPATAIYVVTPLTLRADPQQAQVGDEVIFTIDAFNETTQAQWAGKNVRVTYGYDPNERPEGSEPSPDEPTSNEGYRTGVLRESLALDAKAHATFTWTIPAEAQDHNVFVNVESEAGEPLAHAMVAVGNAPPVILAAGAPGGEAAQSGLENGNPDREKGGENPPADDGRDAPAPGLLAVAAGLGAVALALARRRSG